MERDPFRPMSANHGHHPSQSSFPTSYTATSQPPVHTAYSDPFHTTRDPFLHGSHNRRDSSGLGARSWTSTNGSASQPPPPPNSSTAPSHHHRPSLHSQLPANGLGQMPLPFDPSRRGSHGGPGSPPHYSRDPSSNSTLPPFQARNMPPPPSPPHMPPPSSSSYHSAPRGPPSSSPFAGARDLASFSSSHRPGTGMAISSILSGGGEDRRVGGSPNNSSAPASATTPSMQPPSPGRARSSSLREGLGRKDESPIRFAGLGEPRAATAFHERTVSEPRGDGIFGSQVQRESIHSFRNFQPQQQEHRPSSNGVAQLGRPSSQPIEMHGQRNPDDGFRRDAPNDGRFGTFRQFSDPRGPPPRHEEPARHAPSPYQNRITSQPRDRDIFGQPHPERDGRYEQSRYPPTTYGPPMREEQAGLFRPAFQSAPDSARESIESRAMHDAHREIPRSTPSSEPGPYDRYRSAQDRPMTFEEHQRMENSHREHEHRKGSNDSAYNRAVMNISPELNRRGRNSPLPQAVQGAQPRHVGPGGDNPGIKMEFGRMFSGLGSGVGSITPTAGQSINGSTTPSRMSPMRHVEDGDLVRTAVAGIDDGRNGTKAKGKGGRKTGRRSREETEKMETGDGRATPDAQRGAKRSKTLHHHHHVHPHHHHHHHHHHEAAEPGSFNMLRFPSNPGAQPVPAQQATHHHHHHHNPQPAHHHHHHPPRPLPPARKPVTTVLSRRLLEENASKPRQHLGSQMYTSETSVPSAVDSPIDAKIQLVGKSKPIPMFEGKENCTFTVRVPRWYLTPTTETKGDEPSPFEEICRRRQVWGTEVYTDDSDVVAAAVHSGWLKGDFGEWNEDLRTVDETPAESKDAKLQLSLTARPDHPVKPSKTHDLHITVLILPPLEKYASLNQNHIQSREWNKTHDGMSFMIHRIDFMDEGADSRYHERGAKARKQRLAAEEAKRIEAASGLLMFASGGTNGVKGLENGVDTGVGAVQVGA